jgi:amino-acid N-acetyltransferase
MNIRKAVIRDIEPIFECIDAYAKEGLLLPRTRLSLYEHIQCITVAEEDGQIIGAGSLHVLGKDLAEIRSLVVAPEAKGNGVGKKMVAFCIEEATSLGVEKVFTLTYQTDFFKKCGFHIVDMEIFPEKVWKDCINCPKQHNCDETAMIYRR